MSWWQYNNKVPPTHQTRLDLRLSVGPSVTHSRILLSITPSRPPIGCPSRRSAGIVHAVVGSLEAVFISNGLPWNTCCCSFFKRASGRLPIKYNDSRIISVEIPYILDYLTSLIDVVFKLNRLAILEFKTIKGLTVRWHCFSENLKKFWTCGNCSRINIQELNSVSIWF